MEGWRQSGGDFWRSMDADGTCDPQHFVNMCKRGLSGNTRTSWSATGWHDVSDASGATRRANAFFAFMLGLLSRKIRGRLRQRHAGGQEKPRCPGCCRCPGDWTSRRRFSARALMDDGPGRPRDSDAVRRESRKSKLCVMRDGPEVPEGDLLNHGFTSSPPSDPVPRGRFPSWRPSPCRAP